MSSDEFAHGSTGGSVEMVHEHCAECMAPICPVCDNHTSECPCCGGFHCEYCGYWLGVPVTPFFDEAGSERAARL